MLKAIKWYVVICTMSIFFVCEMASAMLSVQQKKHASHMQKKPEEAVSTPEPGAEKTALIQVLDQQAQHWDYTTFNWIGLYPYFSAYLSCKTFIEATQSGGYTSIDALAEAMEKNNKRGITTRSEGKFFVYSVLCSLYFYYKEKSWQKFSEFNLFSKVHKIAGKELENLTYNKPEPDADEIEQVLQYYSDSFVYNSEIRALRLNNDLLTLLTVIDKQTKLKAKPVKNKFLLLENPTVANLLACYDDDHLMTVFSFLLSYPLQIATVHIPFHNLCSLHAENQLIIMAAKIFKALWVNDQGITRYNYLAKMAIHSFKFNPLTIADLQPSSDARITSVIADIPLSAEVQQAHKTIKQFASQLLSSIPATYSFYVSLLQNRVIDFGLFQNIMSLSSPQDKNRKVIEAVQRDLDTDILVKFNQLLALMEKQGDGNLKALVVQMRSFSIE